MDLGFLKNKLAKVTGKATPAPGTAEQTGPAETSSEPNASAQTTGKGKLGSLFSKIATTAGNAMSDLGLTAANPDRAPKVARTIDEENLKIDVAHGLLLDYSVTDPQSFIAVLNKVAKECHGLHNLGIYADIVSITPSHVLKFETKDNFIHVECFNGENPGNELVNDGTSDNPFQHPFDELLAGGDEDESEENETDGEEEEAVEEEEETDGETDSEEEEGEEEKEEDDGEDDFGEDGEEEDDEDDSGEDDGDDD